MPSAGECAITIVASMSIVISPPPAPGAAAPASAQARSRARRPDRRQRPRRLPGQLADQAGDHRIRRHRPEQRGLFPQHGHVGQAVPAQRQRHRQVRDIFPGSWMARAARHRSSPSDSRRLRPVTCSTWVSSRAPAWDTIPDPSADTMTLGGRAVFFTGKVPSAGCGQDLRQALFSQFKGTFHISGPCPGLSEAKARG